MSEGDERPSRWIPMTNLRDLAHLGKAGEEGGELSSILQRIQIQGIDECDPETGEVNRIALTKETADVLAMCELNIERFNLDQEYINARKERKKAMKRAWHEMLPDADPMVVLRKYIINQITSGPKIEFTEGELELLRELSAKDQVDWAVLDALTDEDIAAQVAGNLDAAPLGLDWSSAVARQPKE